MTTEASSAYRAYRLIDSLRGTLATNPNFPQDDGDDGADTPVFQGGSVTGLDGKTYYIDELTAERDDGIIVTADQDLINCLEQYASVESCDVPDDAEPTALEDLTVPKLLELPQVAEVAKVTDPGKLKKAQLIAAILAVDELGGTIPDDDPDDSGHHLVADAIANPEA